MAYKLGMSMLAAAVLLSACGGGGVNSPGSNPAPTPTPSPTPASTLGNLTHDENFTNDAATTAVAFDSAAGTTIGGSAGRDSLKVAYDAASKSYTLTASGKSVTFLPADILSDTSEETRYQISGGTSSDYLTLAHVPYTSTTATQYVGLGYWQENSHDGTRQNTLFDTFTYGFPTPAAALPRTGSATYGIDVFGLTAVPGYEPTEFDGHGDFTTDWRAGVFAAHAYLTEHGLVTGTTYGEAVDFTAGGHLSSARDGTFDGMMTYQGSHAAISGGLDGRFYGPATQEIGASFAGSNPDGSILAGSFTGQADSSITPANLTLTNIVSQQFFYPEGAWQYDGVYDSGGSVTQSIPLQGQIIQDDDASVHFVPGESSLPVADFTAADRVASPDANFVAYDKTVDGQDVHLDLYRPGDSNSELALTYASFGHWRATKDQPGLSETNQVYFAYGFETPGGFLAVRTGSAQYKGVAYGGATDLDRGASYDVHGTSQFDVDFSNQHFSGALDLQGRGRDGAANVDFGTYSFDGALSASDNRSTAVLIHGGASVGQIVPRFYGPAAEEIAGRFSVQTYGSDPNSLARFAMSGVAAAKRQ